MALEGYRLLDLSRLLPGPSGSQVLADMGMEVIKVEEPEPRGGVGRDSLTPPEPTPEEEVHYSAYNMLARNKRSIALNLRMLEGREVFYRLVKTADAVLESYRPGVVKRLGVDYEAVRQINPRIVYCSISGYGEDGPYADLPGHDINYCSIAGQMALTSDVEGNPVPNMISLADGASGLHAVIGILAALLAREKTGKGQYVDVTLTHSVMPFLTKFFGPYFRDGKVTPRGQPNLQLLECKDGRYVTTDNSETHFWERFCNAIGRPEFIPLRKPSSVNYEAYANMVREVKTVMRTRTRDEWFQVLRDAETCVAPLLEMEEVFQDPQNLHRGMLLELEHPSEGVVRQMGFPILFSETPCRFRNFAPLLGEHSETLMLEIGYTLQQIEELEARGVVKVWRNACFSP